MLINQVSDSEVIVTKQKSSEASVNTASEINFGAELEKSTEAYIPEWVDENYFYGTKNPRKPHLSELMEHMSGKSIHEIYEEPESEWKGLYIQCVDLLYGVVGSSDDTRDWSEIMKSQNVEIAIQKSTGEMYEPELKVENIFDYKNDLVDQKIQVTSKEGNVLRVLSGSIDNILTSMKNFGVHHIPVSLSNQIKEEFHSKEVLYLLAGNANSAIFENDEEIFG